MHEFDDMDEDAPLLRIGPAAELAGMHPQTLRQYDRLGLVVPGRTPGGSRRYSLRNIRQLRQVQELSNDGISLPAIERILDLEDEVAELRHHVVQLQTELQAERENRPGSRVFAAETSGAVVRLQPGATRVRRRAEVVLWRPHA